MIVFLLRSDSRYFGVFYFDVLLITVDFIASQKFLHKWSAAFDLTTEVTG